MEWEEEEKKAAELIKCKDEIQVKVFFTIDFSTLKELVAQASKPPLDLDSPVRQAWAGAGVGGGVGALLERACKAGPYGVHYGS